MTPVGYDPVTLFHWLWWKYRCHTASGEAFEELFKAVINRATDDFMPVRPYGNLGDRKCDGLFFGGGVVYQLYSPDEMKQAATVAKIEEDLAGALEEWGDELRKWVFVYNVRRGVPPDVAKTLQEQRATYPHIEIEQMSDDHLWEIVRKLPLQQRVEILGAPPGYEHIFLMPSALPEDVQERLREGRFVMVQDIMSPINIQDAVAAMAPETPFAPPVHVAPEPSDWEAAAELQKAIVEAAIQRSKDLLPRFAIFSLAPIPMAIHLGYLLSDRVEARLFQYDRDRATWRWSEGVEGDIGFQIEGLPAEPDEAAHDVVVRVSLSARIDPRDTRAVTPENACEVDLLVRDPDVMWLCDPRQLVELGKVVRRLLQELRTAVPNATAIHLFYAGPTGGAITTGRAINPRMNAPVQLYEFDFRESPRYRPVLRLG